MSWAVGYDPRWQRDIGYGVPSMCDHPGCTEEIDRGLAHVCGGEPYGGERGCGLYFCGKHHNEGDAFNLCERCSKMEASFTPSPDTAEWVFHKLTDPSWEAWRKEKKRHFLTEILPSLVREHGSTLAEGLQDYCKDVTPDKPSQPPSGGTQ